MIGPYKAGNNLDPSIPIGTNLSDMGFDLGFGIFYYKRDKLYFGISGQKLLPQKFTFGSASPQIRQHAYITAGFNNKVTPNFDLRPSMLVKTDLTSTQMDLNLTAEFSKALWLGASYRVTDAFVANVGFNYWNKDKEGNRVGQPLKIGLAYDFTMQSLKNRGTFTSWNEAGTAENVNNNNRSVGSVELYISKCIIPPPKPDFEDYTDPLLLY